MDGVGNSLFNGGESIHLNNSIGRQEEEEALEERLRKEELQRELIHFDDFEDDEEDEMLDDSAHFNSINTIRGRRSTLKEKHNTNLHEELLESEKRGGIGNIHVPSDQGDLGKAFHHKYNGRHQEQDNGTHYQHSYQTSNQETHQNIFHTRGLDLEYIQTHSNGQVQLILDAKCREVKKLTEELTKCRKEASNTHEQLYEKLTIAEAEKGRAQVSLQQSMELVENSKHRMMDLEHKVTSLKKNMECVNIRNEELTAEVTAITTSLMDTQSRLQMAQLNKEAAHNTDALFKDLHERHNEDMERLDKDLMKTRKRLQDKENDCSLLEKRCQDLEHAKESLLLEKGSIINQLATELKEAQDRLADMGERCNQLLSEKNTARLQCKDLAHKFEETAKELVDYRTRCVRLQEEQSELDQVLDKLTQCQETNSFFQLHADRPVRGFSAHADKVEILSTELTKKILASKFKDEQIEKLNKILSSKDFVLEQLKGNEDKLNNEIEVLKSKELKANEELKQLTLKLSVSKSNSLDGDNNNYKALCSELERNLKQAKADYNSLLVKHTSLELKYEELNSVTCHKSPKEYSKDWLKEKEKVNYQLKDAQNQVEKFKTLYVEECGEKDKLSKEISDIKSSEIYQNLKVERNEAENLRNLLDTEKDKVEKLQKTVLNLQKKEFDCHVQSFKKSMDSKTEASVNGTLIEELKSQNESLQCLCEDQKKRLHDLSKDIEDSKAVIYKLKLENELHTERDRLIADLKEKGKQFEKYIENQKMKLVNRRDASTCTEGVPVGSTTVSELIQTSPCLIDNTYQGNLKVEETTRDEIAQHFAKQIKKNHQRKMTAVEEEYQNNIMKLSDAVKIKTREVYSLQEAIMFERNKFKEFMSKTSECRESNANYERMLGEYKMNVDKCKDHILKLNNEISELRKEKNKHNDTLKSTFMELDKIKEKYKVLKKCTLKYKEYNVEKDKHVEKELTKIKSAYENKVRKIETKLHEYLKKDNARIQNSNSMEGTTNDAKSTKGHEVS